MSRSTSPNTGLPTAATIRTAKVSLPETLNTSIASTVVKRLPEGESEDPDAVVAEAWSIHEINLS
jgi:hypothetical protein